MNKVGLDNFNMLSKEPSVSVADVQRVRRQRRLARSEEEHAAVREHMRDLAGNLKSKPRESTNLLKISGLIIGGVLFYAADLVWPMWLTFWESLS